MSRPLFGMERCLDLYYNFCFSTLCLKSKTPSVGIRLMTWMMLIYSNLGAISDEGCGMQLRGGKMESIMGRRLNSKAPNSSPSMTSRRQPSISASTMKLVREAMARYATPPGSNPACRIHFYVFPLCDDFVKRLLAVLTQSPLSCICVRAGAGLQGDPTHVRRGSGGEKGKKGFPARCTGVQDRDRAPVARASRQLAGTRRLLLRARRADARVRIHAQGHAHRLASRSASKLSPTQLCTTCTCNQTTHTDLSHFSTSEQYVREIILQKSPYFGCQGVKIQSRTQTDRCVRQLKSQEVNETERRHPTKDDT